MMDTIVSVVEETNDKVVRTVKRTARFGKDTAVSAFDTVTSLTAKKEPSTALDIGIAVMAGNQFLRHIAAGGHMVTEESDKLAAAASLS